MPDQSSLELIREKQRAKAKKYREKNREVINAKQREYNAKHKERYREKAKQYYEDNKEERRATARVQSKTPEKRAYNRQYYAKNKDRLRKYSRDYHREGNGFEKRLSREYDLSRERYDELLVKQNNRCAICGTEHGAGKDRLPVDHDHVTGEVRGLLCGLCNRGIGCLRDDPFLTQRATSYLLRQGMLAIHED